MIPLDHRQRLVQDIDQAHREGAVHVKIVVASFMLLNVFFA